MASMTPNLALREAFAERASDAACLFVDIQKYYLHQDGACFAKSPKAEQKNLLNMRDACAPKWTELLETCRAVGVEVLYTVTESLTQDGRDRSLDYKISGFHVPPGSFGAQVLDCIRPGKDEIVLPKTSCSVFQSTHLDYLLRCLEKRYLVICGGLTDQCVCQAVRDGCDLGYRITVLSDGCVAASQESHEWGLKSMKGFSRVRSVAEMVGELKGLQ